MTADVLQAYKSESANSTPTSTLAQNAESSSTDQSCSVYITRKREQIGETRDVETLQYRGYEGGKASDSASLGLTPSQNQFTVEEMEPSSTPQVTNFDPPTLPTTSCLRTGYGPSDAKVQKFRVIIIDLKKVHTIPTDLHVALLLIPGMTLKAR